MDIHTTPEHPLAGVFTGYNNRVLTYTTGAAPCPVVLGFVDYVSHWTEVAAPVPQKAGRRIEVMLRFVADARPLAAIRKPVPKRVFFRGAMRVSLNGDGGVVAVALSTLDFSEMVNGRYVSVPLPTSWRRRGQEYSGLAADLSRAMTAWARDAVVPLLPPMLEGYATRKEQNAERHDKEAADERALIERGDFTEWYTPERRAGVVAREEGYATKAREEASTARDLAVRCAKVGGTGMDPAEIAALADRAREATERARAAVIEGERKVREAAEAARRKTGEMAAAKAAKERLEAAAPALLAAAEMALTWMTERALHSDATVALAAAIAQAKGTQA
jgi:hypothetical protein